MKLLLVNDEFPPEPTNIGKIVFKLAQAFKNKGLEVFVFTTQKDTKEAEQIHNQNGIKVSRIYTPRYEGILRYYLTLYNPWTVIKFSKFIRELKPDFVHFHNIHQYLSFSLIRIAKKSGAKVFLTAHDVMLFNYGKLVEFINPNDLSIPQKFNFKITHWQQIKRFRKRYNPFRNLIIRRYLKYIDKIFAVSYALKQALNDNGIENVEVIHNGIDVDEWQVNNNIVEDFKKKYNLEDKKVVLFGGRLSELKGGEKIILAMKNVIQKVPEAVLLVVGNRNYYANMMLESAQQLNIEKSIIFTDWLYGDKLKAAFCSSDIVAVPSICFDSFPLTNLEAMACKKPAVGTCFGGTPEIVQAGITGYIINPFNIELMAEKIIDLLKNPQKAIQFGEEGYKRVKEYFNLDLQVNKAISCYLQIPEKTA